MKYKVSKDIRKAVMNFLQVYSRIHLQIMVTANKNLINLLVCNLSNDTEDNSDYRAPKDWMAKKGRVVPIHDMKTYRGRRGTATLILSPQHCIQVSGQLHARAPLPSE